MPNLTRLISDVLRLPDDCLVYEASRRLHDLFPDKFILETEEYDFQLAEYAAKGKCMIHLLEDAFGHMEAVWLNCQKTTAFEPKNGYYEIQWRGKRLHCLALSYGYSQRYFLIADHRQDALDFFHAVCTLEVDAQGEILVYSGGFWRRDTALKKQIESVSLQQIVLSPKLKREVVDDAEAFFASEALYEQHGLAWKRGLLLIGSPGNGKTLTIKGLVNHLKKPCLYVRSFECEDLTRQQSLAKVFRKAREVAPCILVLEDVDSLIGDEELSPLLNEMDGFSDNRGILVIATTNHPDKLDPALLHRPSRFDRKVVFEAPGAEERLAYLTLLDRSRRLAQDELEALAEASKGFSYAYLRELNLAALTRMIYSNLGLAASMMEVAKELRAQMPKGK